MKKPAKKGANARLDATKPLLDVANDPVVGFMRTRLAAVIPRREPALNCDPNHVCRCA